MSSGSLVPGVAVVGGSLLALALPVVGCLFRFGVCSVLGLLRTVVLAPRLDLKEG